MSRYRRASLPGASYFFSVALANRRSDSLVAHIDYLREVYSRVQSAYPFKTIAICVLPEHLHAVWSMPEVDHNFSFRWQLIKRLSSRGLPKAPVRSASKIKHRESGVWQRRFWEHCIRDELDLQRHVDYIHYNPVKHGYVKQVADWPYSSFHRYVRAGTYDDDWAGMAQDDQMSFGE